MNRTYFLSQRRLRHRTFVFKISTWNTTFDQTDSLWFWLTTAVIIQNISCVCIIWNCTRILLTKFLRAENVSFYHQYRFNVKFIFELFLQVLVNNTVDKEKYFDKKFLNLDFIVYCFVRKCLVTNWNQPVTNLCKDIVLARPTEFDINEYWFSWDSFFACVWYPPTVFMLQLEVPSYEPFAFPKLKMSVPKQPPPAPSGGRRTRTLETKALAERLFEGNLENFLLIDGRSFMEYNNSHVVNSVNISCSKLIKRRLQTNKVGF